MQVVGRTVVVELDAFDIATLRLLYEYFSTFRSRFAYMDRRSSRTKRVKANRIFFVLERIKAHRWVVDEWARRCSEKYGADKCMRRREAILVKYITFKGRKGIEPFRTIYEFFSGGTVDINMLKALIAAYLRAAGVDVAGGAAKG